ncbi:hypothetical protein GGS24DRAFT_496640 [Hypoxylon argillaceum]|nr:hypothetical protein GGS24DRAFT_496640 [Hypoxylon argillaceum]
MGSLPVALSQIEIAGVGSYQTCPELWVVGKLGRSSRGKLTRGLSDCSSHHAARAQSSSCGEGTEALLNITEQRREIKAVANDVEASVNWRQCTMMLMDALEPDVKGNENDPPDLAPENLARDINKAAIAFSSGTYCIIDSPL